MNAKQAHESARTQAVHCVGCGVAVAIVVEIPNPTPEQVAEARAVMAKMREYGEHGLLVLRPVELHAEKLERGRYRRGG